MLDLTTQISGFQSGMTEDLLNSDSYLINEKRRDVDLSVYGEINQ